jgi:lysozyme family protein
MTTQTPLDKSLGWLLEEEGGWSDHPNDKGGQTFNGVTQGTYDDWRVRVVKLPKQSVRKATASEIRNLYEVLYWRAAGCDRLPWPLSYVTFDAAVNSGVSRAVRWLQGGLGVEQDGKVGPGTLASANAAVQSGDAAKIVATVDQRVQFLVALVRRDTSQLAFLLGWWRRTQRVLGRALLTQSETEA